MSPGVPRAVGAWLALFLAATILERLWELTLSARHARRLLRRGGREANDASFPWLVAVHVLYPAGLLGEVLWLGVRPGGLWPLWLGLWVGAHALRMAAVRALGDRWHVRVWVVPGEPRIRRGPYRRLRHPNYIAVALELLSGTLLFGAWRTAGLVTAVNLVAVGARIRVEERALDGAGSAPRLHLHA